MNKPQILLILVALANSVTGCSRHDEELNQLRTRAARDEQQLAQLQSELREAKDSIQQLQAKPPTPQATKQESATAIEQTVAKCVKYVRSLETEKETYNQVFAAFDAFYNSATGRVENNNQFVDQKAVYTFNKCMTSKGMPLA